MVILQSLFYCRFSEIYSSSFFNALGIFFLPNPILTCLLSKSYNLLGNKRTSFLFTRSIQKSSTFLSNFIFGKAMDSAFGQSPCWIIWKVYDDRFVFFLMFLLRNSIFNSHALFSSITHFVTSHPIELEIS
mgnify:CR=1 FL=1